MLCCKYLQDCAFTTIIAPLPCHTPGVLQLHHILSTHQLMGPLHGTHLYWHPLSTFSFSLLKSDKRHSYTAPSAPADTMLVSLPDQQTARTCIMHGISRQREEHSYACYLKSAGVR